MVFLSLNVTLGIIFEIISSMFLKMPQGGVIAISTIPIIIVSIRINAFYGVLCGILIGIGQGVFIPPTFIAFIQYFLDYIFAFGIMGLVGLFSRKGKAGLLSLGVIITMLLKYLAHVISGIVYFGEYATGHVVIYSLIYNGSYMLPSLIIVLISLWAILRITYRHKI